MRAEGQETEGSFVISNSESKLSWVDQLLRGFNHLPGPTWLFYFGLGSVLILVLSLSMWLEGVVPAGTFIPAHIYLASTLPFFLLVMDNLNQRAASALDGMRPVLDVEEGVLSSFHQRLITLPGLPALVSMVFALVFVFLTEALSGATYQIELFEGYPISAGGLRLIYLASWCFFGVFIYHTIYQLNLVNQIYSNHVKVNLYRMNPLHGLSNLSAWSAICLILAPYGFLLINPTVQLADPITLVFYIFVTFIAVVTFIWPQLGINRLQRKEKARLLDEAKKRYEKLLLELHRRVDQGEYNQIAALNPGFNLVEAELATIKRTPTWPWQPETIRWFVSALVSPIFIWLIQFLLLRIFE